MKYLKYPGRFAQKNHVLLLSFFLPAVILEITYAAFGIYPFGSRDILIIDLYHQYAPFISGLQDKLGSFSSLLYSWSGGLGTSFLPLFAYYLASPLNLLTVLFPKEYLTETILVLTLLKIGLAGLCFAVYLRGAHDVKGPAAIAFSLLYALSGYVLVFSWDIMWMDTIYLLPLVMLGLVKLVRDGKGVMYCVTLAIALAANFYTAFFLCLFTLLYYPVCLFRYNDWKPSLLLKRSAQVFGYSLLSLGLSSAVILPTWFALRLTSAAGDVFPREFKIFFDLFDYISRHFTGTPPSIRDGMPNLYCGIIVLILVPVYFLCKGIRLKDKLWNVAFLLILIGSFNMNMPDFVWNGLHYPNQLPYRYSFVYVFFILTICIEAYKRLHELSGREIGLICFSILALVLISQKFDDLSQDYLTIYASIIAIILYAAFFTVERNPSVHPYYKNLLLIVVVAAEIIANTFITDNNIDMKEGYLKRDGYSSGVQVDQLRSRISEIAKKDSSFYRMEVLPPKTTNDPFLYSYRGVSLFSSTAPEKPVRMMRDLGYSSNSINSYEYVNSTAILDSLFGVKYLIYRSMNIDQKIYTQTSDSNGMKVFTNPYALPPGYLAPDKIKSFNSSFGSNPFIAQNSLMENISGVKDILVPLEQQQGTQDNLTFSGSGTQFYYYTRTNKDMDSVARIRFPIEGDKQVYLYYKAPSGMKGTGQIKLGDKTLDFNPKNSSIINLGYCKSGTVAEMQIYFDKAASESSSFEVFPYALDQVAFEKAISLIREKSITIDSFSDGNMNGHITAKSDGRMVMTIPYDKGWQVKVDGKEVKADAISDCLLSFELSKGTHTIKLRFIPDKLYAGLGATLLSIIILAFIIYIGLRRSRKIARSTGSPIIAGAPAAEALNTSINANTPETPKIPGPPVGMALHEEVLKLNG